MATGTIDKSDKVNDKANVERRARKMPTYEIREIGDTLPKAAPSGRKQLYYDILTRVMRKPNTWFEIAQFQTPVGAQSVLNSINKGEKSIPAGDWEFDAIKVKNEDNPAGPKHSKLYARYLDDDAANRERDAKDAQAGLKLVGNDADDEDEVSI